MEEVSVAAAQHRRDDQPVVGHTGARFRPLVSRWRHQQQDLEQVVEASPPPVSHPVDGAEWIDWGGWDTVTQTYDLVRPYSWTGGRTTSRVALSVETLVSATGQAADPAAPPEHGTILSLCATPCSVAELSALLSMPFGVTRVVLGDMAEAGKVVVHRTVGPADLPDIDLLQRVLNGLQRL
ncbi:MAG: DUF742 domain-containing protein [Pseudonocardiaceae bacterium]